MALITDSKYTSSWMGGAPRSIEDKASSFNLSIGSTYLSEPYDLKVGDKIEGEILAGKGVGGEEYQELKGREIEFILYPLGGFDHLFISKKDWEENFREYGLVMDIYLAVRLGKAVREDGRDIPLYTKKDVHV